MAGICKGQNNIEFNPVRTLDSLMTYHFMEFQPLCNVFVGGVSVPEIINNSFVDLLLEYKKECYNDSVAEIIESYMCASDDLEYVELMFNRMGEERAWLKFWDSILLEVMDEPFPDNSVSVTDGFGNISPVMRYEKYRIKTIRTNHTHKAPSFEDFLNWIEKRKAK